MFALTPFNFTSIAGNLPSAPALMGNVAVWKPAQSQVYSAQVIVELFHEAGLPDGVINLVHVSGSAAGDASSDIRSSPASTSPAARACSASCGRPSPTTCRCTAATPHRGRDRRQGLRDRASQRRRPAGGHRPERGLRVPGQKCSAASRAYIPDNLWPKVKEELVADVNSFTMGDPKDFSHFINAVIDEKAFDKIAGYIEHLKREGHRIIAGGGYDKEKGCFIEPTVAVVSDPKAKTMCEEIFGPILTIYVYKADAWMETPGPAGRDQRIRPHRCGVRAGTPGDRGGHGPAANAAGNFYINDKPTGAVVGQQPFGGAVAAAPTTRRAAT